MYWQLSAVTSLTRLLNTASPLPIFSASYGHTYMPPLPKHTDTAQPQQSKENTPMPDAHTQSKASLAGSTMSGSTWEDTRNLMESFALLSKYGDEYMDENPLVGEPGNFILSRSSDAVAARQQNKPATPVPGSIGRVGTPSLGKIEAGKGPKTSEKEREKTPTTPDGDNKLKRKKSSRVEIVAP